MRALAIDPGKATGFASYWDGEHRAWWLPYDPKQGAFDAALSMRDWIKRGMFDLVVCESIVITGRTHKKSQDVLLSVEQIGIARWLCHENDTEFVTQTPSEGKAFGTDQKLRALGWWTVGLDHPRDASRHLMLALTKRDSAFAADLAGRV